MEANRILTAQEVLSKRIIRFPSDDALMTDEAIKRNVVAAMEEYANSKLHLLQQEYQTLSTKHTLIVLASQDSQKQMEILQQEYHKLEREAAEEVNDWVKRCNDLARERDALKGEYDKLKGENEKLHNALNISVTRYTSEMAAHAALKDKADKMAMALRTISTSSPFHSPSKYMVIAIDALSSYNSTKNENNGTNTEAR